MALIGKISGEEFAVDNINKERLDKIYNSWSLVFNAEKYNLGDYVEIHKIDVGFEVDFKKCLPEVNKKCKAFLLLSTFFAEYDIDVIGVSIAISVGSHFQAELGGELIEKLFFPTAVNMWDFNPDKKTAIVDLPAELCKKILLVQSGILREFESEYMPVEIPTKQILSLIVV